MAPNFFSYNQSDENIGNAVFFSQSDCRIFVRNILTSNFNYMTRSELSAAVFLALTHFIFESVASFTNILPISAVTKVLAGVIGSIKYFSNFSTSLAALWFREVFFVPKMHPAISNVTAFPVGTIVLGYLRHPLPLVPSRLSFFKRNARLDSFDKPALYISHRL